MRHRSVGILLSTGLQKPFRDNVGHLAAPSWADSTPLPKENQQSVDALPAAFLLGPAGSMVTPRSWTPHWSSQPALQPHPKTLGWFGTRWTCSTATRSTESAPCWQTGCAGTLSRCQAAKRSQGTEKGQGKEGTRLGGAAHLQETGKDIPVSSQPLAAQQRSSAGSFRVQMNA